MRLGSTFQEWAHLADASLRKATAKVQREKSLADAYQMRLHVQLR